MRGCRGPVTPGHSGESANTDRYGLPRAASTLRRGLQGTEHEEDRAEAAAHHAGGAASCLWAFSHSVGPRTIRVENLASTLCSTNSGKV